MVEELYILPINNPWILLQKVLTKLASRIKKPKLNNSLKDVQEKTRRGCHRPTIHRSRVEMEHNSSCCATNAQMPQPLAASSIVMDMDTMAEMMSIMANFLNCNCFRNRLFWIMLKALMMSTKPSTRRTAESNGIS